MSALKHDFNSSPSLEESVSALRKALLDPSYKEQREEIRKLLDKFENLQRQAAPPARPPERHPLVRVEGKNPTSSAGPGRRSGRADGADLEEQVTGVEVVEEPDSIEESLSLLVARIKEHYGDDPKAVKQKKLANEYTCRCPGHDDRSPSLTVAIKQGEDCDRIVLHCFKGCKMEEILGAIDYEPRWLFSFGLSHLAGTKNLPAEFLRKLHLREWSRRVVIPVLNKQGFEVCKRFRMRVDDDRCSVQQERGQPLYLYGEWPSPVVPRADYTVFVEGESDCWTLWHHGVPALGIPGARNAKVIQSHNLDGLAKVYVWQEPDEGGVKFVAGVLDRLKSLDYRGEIFTLRHPDHKDPSEVHCAGADFENVWASVIEKAQRVEPEAPSIVRAEAPKAEPERVDLEKSKADPRTAYLWRGHHARLTDDMRRRRIASVEEAWRYIPPGGFFDAYIRSCLPTTDAPVIFHLAASLALAGHCVNRKVWMRFGQDRLYPQFWVAQIGKSGDRKSTSKDIVLPLLAAAPDYADTILSSAAFSMEGIYLQLGPTAGHAQRREAGSGGVPGKAAAGASHRRRGHGRRRPVPR